jgi:hypothetical protein
MGSSRTGQSQFAFALGRGRIVIGIVGGILVLVLLFSFGSCIAPDRGGRTASVLSPAPASSSASGPAPTPAASGVAAVPAVVGKGLVDAVAVLAEAGFKRVVPMDATGQGRLVLNPYNWVVRTQSPAADTTVATSTRIFVSVRKPSDGAGSSVVTRGVVPDVVCKDLQSAQDSLQAAGFYNLRSVDATGEGRVQVVDRNWVVTAQSVAPGVRSAMGTRIVLRTLRTGELPGRSDCVN